MNKYFYINISFVFVLSFHIAFAQSTAPRIIWQQTLGGSNEDVLTAMAIAPNNAIILCGYSNSGISGNKSATSFGGYDYWIVKMDDNGNVLWNKTYGGNDDDFASAIICTSDGGYLVGGSSVSDKSESKTFKSYEFSFDYWVLKLDVNGNIQWDRTLGGTYTEQLTGLAQLPNGTYVIGGYSHSNRNGTKKSANKASETNADYWTVILNTDGSEKTQYLFGGTGHDVMTCVSRAGVSGFYAAGYSYSMKGGNKSVKSFGNNDFWIVRSNLKGQIEFQADYGGKLSDYMTCMQALPDSSLIFGGYSNSYRSNTKTDNFYGITDFWLLKLKRDGTKQWDKTIAGSGGGDYLMSVQQTRDKGFILGGYSNSNTGHNKTENSKGGYDYWLVKTDSLGNVQWDKTIGGSGKDMLTAVYEIADNEYIVAGTSASAQSGDKSAGTVGGGIASDYWVLRLDATQSATKLASINTLKTNNAVSKDGRLEVIPNPVKDVLTIKYSAGVKSKIDFVIYDANGRAVLQATLSATSVISTRSFNVANLPAGSYFAVMYVDGVKLTKAFNKE